MKTLVVALMMFAAIVTSACNADAAVPTPTPAPTETPTPAPTPTAAPVFTNHTVAIYCLGLGPDTFFPPSGPQPVATAYMIVEQQGNGTLALLDEEGEAQSFAMCSAYEAYPGKGWVPLLDSRGITCWPQTDPGDVSALGNGAMLTVEYFDDWHSGAGFMVIVDRGAAYKLAYTDCSWSR